MKNLLIPGISAFIPECCLVCKKKTKNRVLCRNCTPVTAKSLPNRCKLCFSLVYNNSGAFCSLCRHFPLAFHRTGFIWEYSPALLAFIHAMKYSPSKRLCHYAGAELARFLEFFFHKKKWDLLIPAPSSNRAIRERTFNHCLEIAKIVQKKTDIPVSRFALLNRGDKPAQASLPHNRRIQNIRGMLHASREKVYNKKVLLIDDIVTTGATTSAAANALLKAGAATVDVVSLTRSPAWIEYRSAIHRAFYLSPRFLRTSAGFPETITPEFTGLKTTLPAPTTE